MAFDGKVALVTGGGSGIGEATALVLARQGVMVGVLDVVEPAVAKVVDAIVAEGGAAMPLIADVSDEAQTRSAIEALVAEAGRLDIIVANAGINGVWAPIDDLTPAEWDRTVNINLRGTYLTLHFGVPHLRAAGGGAIVLLSSINGTRTFSTAGATVYTATKAAIAAMSNQLAIELGVDHIRVNAVAPGGTRTNIGSSTIRRNTERVQHPVTWPEGTIPLTRGKPASPAEIADAIAFLCSDAARHVSGAVLHVDGAQSLVR